MAYTDADWLPSWRMKCCVHGLMRTRLENPILSPFLRHNPESANHACALEIGSQFLQGRVNDEYPCILSKASFEQQRSNCLFVGVGRPISVPLYLTLVQLVYRTSASINTAKVGPSFVSSIPLFVILFHSCVHSSRKNLIPSLPRPYPSRSPRIRAASCPPSSRYLSIDGGCADGNRFWCLEGLLAELSQERLRRIWSEVSN